MITDLTPEQKKAVIQILKKITKQCDLGAIAVVTSEGQELAFFAEQGTDSVIMAALASALNAAGMQTVTQLKYGELDQVIIKGKEGFVILQNTGEVITLAASREIYSLAFAKLVFYDVRGNVLDDVRVVLSREGKEIERDLKNVRNTTFFLPPGVYNCRVYSNGRVVAKQKIDVFFEKEHGVVTVDEPSWPFLMFLLIIVFLFFSGYFYVGKKDKLRWLSLLGLGGGLTAVLMPWWGLTGDSLSSSLSVVTNIYLIPSRMVTVVSGSEVIGGNIGGLPDLFVGMINMLPFLTLAGGLLIFLNLFFDKKNMSQTACFM